MPFTARHDDHTRRALLTRLLSDPGAAESSHLAVAALVMGLLWHKVPGAQLVAWVAGVGAVAVLRVVVRHRLSRQRRTLAGTPLLLRFSIVAVALAWGLGALALAPEIPAFELALLMVVFCGLAAAATVTLLGDPPTYYAYVASLLLPLAFGVLRAQDQRSFVISFVLLTVYGAVMAVLYRRLHGVLLDSLNTARRLAVSQQEAERERNFLDALIASAPTAIVILDANQRVRRVNPAFERTFGFAAGEAIGGDIDELIVPPSERGAAGELGRQAMAGGTMTLESTRCRRDGTLLEMRISAAGLPGEGGGTLVLYDDVTETKRAEAQLRESEQRLFRTLESLPVGIMVVDRDGIPMFANELAGRLLGRGVVPGTGSDKLAEVYQAYVAGTRQLYPTERMPIVRALNGEASRVDDMEIQHPNGGRTDLEVSGSPILDSEGRVAFGVAAFNDITARRRHAARVAARNAVVRVLAETALADTELLPKVLAAVCESFAWDAGSTWRVDREHNVLRLAGFWHGENAHGIELARVSRGMTMTPGEGVPGKIWQRPGPAWFPDFTRDASPARARAASMGGIRSAIGLPLRVGGEVIGVLEFFGTTMEAPESELLGALAAIGSQVGEALERREAERARREAEAQYRELVEAASDLVWRIDATGRMTFVNWAVEQIYGWTPEEVVGRLYTDFSDAEYVAFDREAMASVLSGGTLIDYETVHRDAAGEAVHLSTSARPIYDGTGAVIGVTGIARDIEARAAARDALQAARDAAEQAAAARSAFLANMSHEIRTPLNGVLGMAELLLDSSLNEEDRRAVEMILSSGESLLGIINDILDFSKIEADQMEIEQTEFDLPALVESTARMLMARANAQGLELVTDIAESVPQYVIGDPTRLRQVLTNLVGNAVKFTTVGEVVVRIAPVAGHADRLTFEVRDTGVGISADTIDAIFEPFRQADATTTRRFGGTGLGLSISRRLVGLMGGTLRVASRLGEGSTFGFDLSLPRVANPPAPATPRADLAGVRVLIVDDSPTNRSVMVRMFDRAGCEVDAAASGGDALVKLHSAVNRRAPYQLLVTDVFMPEMDGFDLASAVHDDPLLADLRVIMLTSAARRGDLDRSKRLGVSAYLLKPAGRTELAAAAAMALGLVPAAPRRASAPHTLVGETGPARHVLLAEDNVVNQEVAAALLRRRGHMVDVVPNGREAVEAVRRGHYDVVLMDLQMPELDGLQATAEIRTWLAGRPLPIVALTANAMVGERERCMAAGLDGYLSKPYKPHELFAAVESWGAAPATEFVVAAAESRPGESVEDPVDVYTFRAQMRAAGVEEAVDSILDVFLLDAPSKMAGLAAAIAGGEARAIARAAHAFKSSAGTIHAGRLAELLRGIEMDASGGMLEHVAAGLAETQAAFDAVVRQLQLLRGTPRHE